MKTHVKKVDKTQFENILDGSKTFEIRLADWECSEGDTLKLVEIDNSTREPTGRAVKKIVGNIFMTKGNEFWSKGDVDEHGYQILSLLDREPT